MDVKGFIIQDGQGRDFVLLCEQSNVGLRNMFSLRGWQRRRPVPLQCTEQDLRRIVADVLLTLDALFTSLPRFMGDPDKANRTDLGVPATHRHLER